MTEPQSSLHDFDSPVVESPIFRRLECVCVHTSDIEASEAFYSSLGLITAWRIERRIDGAAWNLVGMRFADAASSELVLSDHPENRLTEVEIFVGDVRDAATALSRLGVTWIREPFATESGHVAVMEAPDGNVFILVGA